MNLPAPKTNPHLLATLLAKTGATEAQLDGVGVAAMGAPQGNLAARILALSGGQGEEKMTIERVGLGQP